MIDISLVQFSNSFEQIVPDSSDLLFAEFVFVFDHELIEIEAAWEILGDDVVVVLGFEEIYDVDDFVDCC